MSTETQALNRSMPNQWARSAINVYQGHQLVIDQCQTNGLDLSSYVSIDEYRYLNNLELAACNTDTTEPLGTRIWTEYIENGCITNLELAARDTVTTEPLVQGYG